MRYRPNEGQCRVCMHQINHTAPHPPRCSRDYHPYQYSHPPLGSSVLGISTTLRGTFTGSLWPEWLRRGLPSTTTDTALQQEPDHHHTPYPHSTPSPPAVGVCLLPMPPVCLRHHQRYSVQVLLAA